MTSHYVLSQIINESTHILENNSSCTDLIFTSQPNMVLDNGVHYPPPYERDVWHYKYANTSQIKNALASFDWEQALSNSSIDKMISILNETIINVMSNYIPNGIKVF